MNFIPKKAAVRIDRTYDNYCREPEYFQATEERVQEYIANIQADPDSFASMQAHDDGLPSPPHLTFTVGKLGFADPDMKIPVVARVQFTWKTGDFKNRPVIVHRSLGNKLFWGVAFLIGTLIVLTMVVSSQIQQNVYNVQRMQLHCIIHTHNGEPVAIEVGGDKFRYGPNGIAEVVHRELSTNEQEYIRYPWTYCKWESDDNVIPWALTTD